MRKRLLLIVLSLALSGTAFSQSEGSSKFAITASAGTNGVGGDLTLSISDHLNTRIGYHGVNYTLDGILKDQVPAIDYDVNFDVSSYSLMLDFYPFKKFIGLTLGAFLHSFTVNGEAKSSESYEVGNKIFSPDDLGVLNANLTYSDELMPYAGIILSNPVSRGIPIKIHVQAGLLYSKEPAFEMTGTGMIAPTANNQGSIQEGLNEFSFFPVVNAGLSIRFGGK